MSKHYKVDEIREIIILDNIYKEMFQEEDYPVTINSKDKEKIDNFFTHIKTCSKCKKVYDNEIKVLEENFNGCSCCEGCNGCK